MLVTTHARVVAAPADGLWPWLAQMGWGRAGWYSIDRIDNGGRPSARVLLPGTPPPRRGDLVPADGRGGAFEVLVADEPRALVLGCRVGPRGRIRPLSAAAGERDRRLTWALVLHPAGGGGTRVLARLRVAGPAPVRRHAPWIRDGHAVMQRAQLRNLARRAEGP